VVVLPKHIVVVPVIPVAGSEVSVTEIFTLRQMVVLQVPSARTKYVVFVEGETVMLFPVPSAVPPHDPLYHFQLAPAPKLPPFTEMVTAWPKHTVVEPLIEVAGIEVSLEIIVLLIQVVESQLPFARTKNESVLAILTTILLPVPRNVLPVPNPHPPLNHCQTAPTPNVPPFTVSVTLLRTHAVSALDVIPVAAEEPVSTCNLAQLVNTVSALLQVTILKR
jgi:hypothetical protein